MNWRISMFTFPILASGVSCKYFIASPTLVRSRCSTPSRWPERDVLRWATVCCSSPPRKLVARPVVGRKLYLPTANSQTSLSASQYHFLEYRAGNLGVSCQMLLAIMAAYPFIPLNVFCQRKKWVLVGFEDLANSAEFMDRVYVVCRCVNSCGPKLIA